MINQDRGDGDGEDDEEEVLRQIKVETSQKHQILKELGSVSRFIKKEKPQVEPEHSD